MSEVGLRWDCGLRWLRWDTYSYLCETCLRLIHVRDPHICQASLDNYREQIAGSFADWNVKVFYATEPSQMSAQLHTDLRPTASLLLANLTGLLHWQKRNAKLLVGVRLCLEHAALHSPPDFVLITRFDLVFHYPLYPFLRLHRLNLVSHLELPHLVDDNLYGMPFSALKVFHDVAAQHEHSEVGPQTRSYYNSHTLAAPLRKHIKLHFMMDEHRAVHNLSFYSIMRISD